MFFENRLIISYIYEANPQRYLFQLTGGEEKVVTREEFFSHLAAYRHFEARQAIKYEHEYRPLPVTVTIEHKVDLYPINLKKRLSSHNSTSVNLQPPANDSEINDYPSEAMAADNKAGLIDQQVNYLV